MFKMGLSMLKMWSYFFAASTKINPSIENLLSDVPTSPRSRTEMLLEIHKKLEERFR